MHQWCGQFWSEDREWQEIIAPDIEGPSPLVPGEENGFTWLFAQSALHIKPLQGRGWQPQLALSVGLTKKTPPPIGAGA